MGENQAHLAIGRSTSERHGNSSDRPYQLRAFGRQGGTPHPSGVRRESNPRRPVLQTGRMSQQSSLLRARPGIRTPSRVVTGHDVTHYTNQARTSYLLHTDCPYLNLSVNSPSNTRTIHTPREGFEPPFSSVTGRHPFHTGPPSARLGVLVILTSQSGPCCL